MGSSKAAFLDQINPEMGLKYRKRSGHSTIQAVLLHVQHGAHFLLDDQRVHLANVGESLSKPATTDICWDPEDDAGPARTWLLKLNINY